RVPAGSRLSHRRRRGMRARRAAGGPGPPGAPRHRRSRQPQAPGADRGIAEGRVMASATVTELRKKSEAVAAKLYRQLEGMEPYLERSDAPGEWTTREVLCHILSEPGWNPEALLGTFAERDLPVIEISPGSTYLTPERQKLTLAELADAL